MNDIHSTPPPLPAASFAAIAPGELPEDRLPIAGVIPAIEAILRQPRRILFQLRQSGSSHLIFAMLAVAIVCTLIYGAVVGTFSRGDQLWIAPVKIAGGLLVAALICLPSLYIFSCLNGSKARLIEVAGLAAGMLALLSLLLVGFAPVAWVFSESTKSLVAMGVLHLLFFIVAAYFGLRFLHAGFAHLSTRPAGLRVWVAIFLLVLLQMTAALRPILGPGTSFFPAEKKFFVAHWMECLKE